ncbi:MAG: T9SS type A sorting domain-containing protein [Taibaiella sp.]
MKQLSLLIICSIICSMAFGQSIFTNNGVFTVPAGVNSVTIEVVGAGGTGGGNGGGGGGGGGYASGTFTVVPGSTHTVTIGAGGSGIATTISGLAITATAGDNGTFVANPGIGGGGAGGVGSGGTVNHTGGAGGGGYWTYFGGGGGGAAGPTADGGAGGNTILWTGICQTPGGAGGTTGGAPGGVGGKGAGFTDVNCNVTDPATVGSDYGGGGGGANGNGGAATTGSGGYCKISWCAAVAAPTGSEGQAICGSGTIADLTATGNGIQWYAAASGGTALAATMPLVNNTHYFASQTVGTCESDSRLDVLVTVVTLDLTTTVAQHTITANAAGVNYKWINCSGNQVIAGATAQSYTATQNGNYAVIITKNGCSDTSACVTISGITDISEISKDRNFTIYPNPATDQITVKVNSDLLSSAYTITDQSGRVVLKGILKQANENIDIVGLTKGVYIFSIGDRIHQSFKVIKK